MAIREQDGLQGPRPGGDLAPGPTAARRPASAEADSRRDAGSWSGYPLPSSNTTYVPNQFFDVVLPHNSRGAVRLVGYMTRRILGSCDARGHPQEQALRSPNKMSVNITS